jgi:hypothetical protein
MFAQLIEEVRWVLEGAGSRKRKAGRQAVTQQMLGYGQGFMHKRHRLKDEPEKPKPSRERRDRVKTAAERGSEGSAARAGQRWDRAQRGIDPLQYPRAKRETHRKSLQKFGYPEKIAREIAKKPMPIPGPKPGNR